MNRLGITLIAVTMAGFSYGTNLYHYEFAGIPKTQISCVDAASQIAQAFKVGTGLKLARAQCARDGSTDYDITLYYSADLEVEPVSTLEYRSGVPTPPQGSYVSLADCQGALPPQLALFRQQTALEPVTAYCYQESGSSRRPFVLRIDAFGQPKTPLLISKQELFGTPLGDIDPLEKQLTGYAAAKLPFFVGLRLDEIYGSYSVRTAYYEAVAPDAPLGRTVGFETIASFRANGSCQQTLQLAQARLTSLSPAPPVFCVHDRDLVVDTLYIYQVKKSGYVELVSYPRSYASFADCAADEAAALKDVTSSMGATAIGDVCVGDAGTVGMRVFVQR